MATMKIHESLLYARNAGADLSGSINLLAHVDTDGDIVLAGAGDVAIGSIFEAAIENKPVTVQTGGIMKVKLGSGGVTAGAGVKPAAGGLGVSGAGAGDINVGIALITGLEDEIVSVLHYPHTVHA
jgi:hypothetical protein